MDIKHQYQSYPQYLKVSSLFKPNLVEQAKCLEISKSQKIAYIGGTTHSNYFKQGTACIAAIELNEKLQPLNSLKIKELRVISKISRLTSTRAYEDHLAIGEISKVFVLGYGANGFEIVSKIENLFQVENHLIHSLSFSGDKYLVVTNKAQNGSLKFVKFLL